MQAQRFFDRLTWHDDRVELDDLVFRLEGGDEVDDGFRFYKNRALVEQYATFWARRADLSPRAILELGMWDGGSMAFWYECFEPRKIVGVDLMTRGDGEYFRRFVESRDLGDRVRTCWGVDQADAEALRGLVAAEFPDDLDLVVDDASHRYGPTKASFEIVFPLLAPGGLYIVEDWAWAHWNVAQTRDHQWAREPSLTDLVDEAIAAIGSNSIVASATVHQGFAVFERGGGEARTFSLDDAVVQRAPARSLVDRTSRRIVKRVRRVTQAPRGQ